MIEHILGQFPTNTHALTLVSDPDGILAEEQVLAQLSERGFTLLNEPDRVHLRHRVESARPFRTDRPLIVVTPGPLNALPYDLWQQSLHVTLALHTFFPNLAYPIVRALSPAQRLRLAHVPAPPRRLGHRASMDHVLRFAFAADLDALQQPARLIAWLSRHHQQSDPMPAILADYMLERLEPVPGYADWPLGDLIASRNQFSRFVGEQWVAYVQKQTGQPMSGVGALYVLEFEEDSDLQDAVPSLVRDGSITPLVVDQPSQLPRWAHPAVLASHEDRSSRRMAELLTILSEQLTTPLEGARWEQWQTIARLWAELNTLRYGPDGRVEPVHLDACAKTDEKLDAAFVRWLERRYAPLASQRLPVPHHVYHVPHYVAYQRRQGDAERVALIILDGMSLEDWILISRRWLARHPEWRFLELLLLAQLPTVTAISRQALTSGLRPADLPNLHDNQSESRQWSDFWVRQGVPAELCAHARLNLDRREQPDVLESPRIHALCLVDTKIDAMVHSSSLGASDLQASLRVWLDDYGQELEEVIARLLDRGFVVYLSSDHGHVQARGMGQPSEGLAVYTRGSRARVYSDRRAMENVQRAFPDTVLWHQDGVLPDGVWVLMPQGRRAFSAFQEVVVTHGGPTLDEVVVPLVTITRR